MSLGALLGGLAIVGTAMAAGAYLLNKLSQDEETRQEQLRERYREYEDETCREYKRIKAEYEKTWKHLTEEASEKLEQERKKTREENKIKFASIYNEYKKAISEQRTLKADFLKQCLVSIQSYDRFKEQNYHTFSRMNSLMSIILTFEEAIYKLEAYLCYLDRYEKNLDKYFQEEGKIIEPFSMVLPEYWPYPGKIYHAKKSEIHEYKFKPNKGMHMYIPFPSDKELLSSLPEDTIVPLMVLSPKENGEIPSAVSVGNGMLKESLGSLSGISAKVTNIKGAIIHLECFGKRITMHERELIKKRSIPVGSFLDLYVVECDFALKGKIKLTERKENSASLMFFDNVVITYSNEELVTIKKYLQSKNFMDIDDEWQIGPVYDANNRLSGLKFQLSRYYGMLVSIDEKIGVDGSSKGKYFRFIRMLREEEMMSYSDVFVAVDVSLAACLLDTVNKSNSCEIDEMLQNCDELLFYLSAEYCKQEKINSDSRMALYFRQWHTLTERLAEVIKKSDRKVLNVESWWIEQVGKRKYTMIIANNAEKVFSFMKREESRLGTKQFFAETQDVNGQIKSSPCKSFKLEDGTILFRINDIISNEGLLLSNFEIPVYSLTFPYAEIQQIRGFDDFRNGAVSSSNIKEIILNVKTLEYSDNGRRISKLYNGDILKNESQLLAVSRSFSSEDFFMIQGPPGTGKTTVIRELIMQQLQFDANSRILVVSQSNVAVDNVLRGLSSIGNLVQNNCIVRCGSDEKIADDIKMYSYLGQLNQYRCKLQLQCSVPKLRQRWLDIIENENDSFVGECLMHSFQIIGATCVGLSSRKLGLQGLEFDLVIIDEAGKALPGELIIPINRAKKLVIIGDHKQLPPVVNPNFYKDGNVRTDDVLDDDSADFFNKSFFERLWDDCPTSNKVMLTTQFRMPLPIAELVNIFYDGKLHSGENCNLKKPLVFGHNLVMIDMKGNSEYFEQQEINSGPYNLCEARTVALLCNKLRAKYKGRIVIITPYKIQRRHIWDEVKKNCPDNIIVNTVDAFQGDEEDIVIFCSTRAKKPTEYFSHSSRLNVAFSRARHNLIIIASSDYFCRYPEDKPIRKVYEYIEAYGKIIPYSEINSDDFDMQFDCDNRNYPLEQINATQLDDSVQTRIDTLCSEAAPPTKRFCEKCYSVLKDYEEILCSECIKKIATVKCKCCRKDIKYSLMDEYIAKKEPPSLCKDCGEFKCSCGNIFMANKKTYSNIVAKGRKVYCKECNKRRSVIAKRIKCTICGELIQCSVGMIEDVEEGIIKQLPTLCNVCRGMKKREYDKMICTVCGSTFSFTYGDKEYYDKKKLPYPCICKACLSTVYEAKRCKCCGKKLEYTYRDKHYYESKHRKLPIHCRECADKEYLRLTCRDCGNKFSYTYGQFQNNTDKGYDTPVRCEKCRRSRKQY